MCKNLSGGGCCVYRLDTLEREEASHEESQRQEHNKGLRQKEPSRTGRRPVVTELQQKGCMRWGGRGEERWNHPSNIGHDHKSGSHGKQICKPEKGFLQRSSVIWFTFSKKKKKNHQHYVSQSQHEVQSSASKKLYGSWWMRWPHVLVYSSESWLLPVVLV